MAVTIQKIAELSGVSRGTVDRALNNRGDVRPEVARTIREIADRLGYTCLLYTSPVRRIRPNS